MMKSTFASSILISLLLFASLSHARKEPGDYWKSIMKDKPMPKALKELFHQDNNEGIKRDHFVKEFDMRSVAIIYHSKPKPKAEKEEEEEEEKSFKKELKVVPADTQELKKNLYQLHN